MVGGIEIISPTFRWIFRLPLCDQNCSSKFLERELLLGKTFFLLPFQSVARKKNTGKNRISCLMGVLLRTCSTMDACWAIRFWWSTYQTLYLTFLLATRWSRREKLPNLFYLILHLRLLLFFSLFNPPPFPGQIPKSPSIAYYPLSQLFHVNYIDRGCDGENVCFFFSVPSSGSKQLAFRSIKKTKCIPIRNPFS